MLWLKFTYWQEAYVVSYISIHLMLWLKRPGKAEEAWEYKNFNTSHVVVKDSPAVRDFANKGYFNTSHVVVKERSLTERLVILLYFNTSHVVVKVIHVAFEDTDQPISIHLMLWLKIPPATCFEIFRQISIHLMLWLKSK